MAWQNIDLDADVGPLGDLLSAIKDIAEFTEGLLTPLVPVVAFLQEALLTLADGKLDLSFILDLFLHDVSFVHLYPQQPYKLLTLTEWSLVCQRCFQVSLTDRRRAAREPLLVRELEGKDQINCVAPPYTLVVVGVSSEDAQELLRLVAQLLELFGEAPTGWDDFTEITNLVDQLDELDEVLDRAFDRNTLLTQCKGLDDLIPYLGEAIDAVRPYLILTTGGVVGIIARVLLRKLEIIEERLEFIFDFLKFIQELEFPNVWVVEAPLNDLNTIATTLLNQEDGPPGTDAFAGTAMLLSGPALFALRLLLGLEPGDVELTENLRPQLETTPVADPNSELGRPIDVDLEEDDP